MSNNDLMGVYSQFGGWLCSAMYQADISVAEMAKKMKVSTVTVYNWLNGRHRPTSWGRIKELGRLIDADPNCILEAYYR